VVIYRMILMTANSTRRRLPPNLLDIYSGTVKIYRWVRGGGGTNDESVMRLVDEGTIINSRGPSYVSSYYYYYLLL